MSFVECEVCETFFTNPRPTPEILSWFYKDSVNYNYWDKYIFPSSERARRKKIVAPRVDKIINLCKKFGVKTGSILEVGAGHGTFCQEMMSRKIFEEVIAVEPVASQAKTCESKGIRTINSTIEKIKFNKKDLFDVVVNFEVMEHLFSPKGFISNCQKFFKKGGLFIFTLPNGKGFDISTLGKLSDSVDHEHLNYFNPKSIELLLNKCGFKVVDISTPGKLDAELVRKRMLSGEFKADIFLEQILIDNWEQAGDDFQKFISNHRLSSHMMVVAKKK
ncbi:MAG: class I SAM-dependent methyltransferase [Candidatus Moranbacteria bacterium]|nr:class I SAM-dependent methyltransferase [Candidatus Moranbacteria bacterium]